MLVPRSVWRILTLTLICAMGLAASAQSYLISQGGEFSVLGPLAGDQVNPAVALNAAGGCVVWEDNVTDKNGAGISACRLIGNTFIHATPFRVDKAGYSDQIRPQIAVLQNGGSLFVWESRALGNPDIFARLMKADGTFLTRDLRLNTYIKDAQRTPAVAALLDGGAIAVWSSYGQDGSLAGVFARKISATGVLSPAREFQVNQFTQNNQRSPAVASLANGNFVVVWISELQRNPMPTFAAIKEQDARVDVYARIFSPNGTAITDEIEVNSGTNICANPAVAGLSDGGFTVAWSERDKVARTNGWDVMARGFSGGGTPVANDFKVNTFEYGDQFRPKIAAAPSGCFMVWTSLGQDGSREGVFGRFLPGGSQAGGNEFRVNTTTANQQIEPFVVWNGSDRFLVVWSSLVAGAGFDLVGQAYALNPSP